MYLRTIKYFILITVFFVAGHCYSRDTLYIRPFSQNAALMYFNEFKNNTILYEYLTGENTFEPNRPLSIGVGFVGERIGIRLGYGFDFLKSEKDLNTESFDFQYHYYGKRLFFDAIIQSYKGYHLNNRDNDSGIYDDLKTFKSGVFCQYIFNNKKFSYRAAHNLREQQLKSAGSFLLGAGIYYSEISFDSSYLLTDSISSGKLKLTNFQIGPSAGYAYNWIIARKINIFASISAGINLGFNGRLENISAYPAVIPRFSVGYNLNSWSFNFSYVNDLIYAYINNDQKVAISSGSMQISVIKRFNIKNEFYGKINEFVNKLFPEK